MVNDAFYSLAGLGFYEDNLKLNMFSKWIIMTAYAISQVISS